MPTVLEGAVSPPHLHLSSRSQTWPSPYTAQHHYHTPSSSPSPMSPQSIQSYIPRTHKTAIFSQDLTGMPTSSWYSPAVSSPAECSNDPGFGSYAYDQSCVPHHTSSIPLSLPTPPFPEAAEAPISATPRHLEHPVAAVSPVSFSRELAHSDNDKPEDSHALPNSATTEASVSAVQHLLLDPNVPARPHSSPSTFSPNQPAPSPVGMPWSMGSMDLPTSALPEAYYSHTSYPSARNRSPRLSEPAMDLPTSMANPQPRRLYTPIAPHPHALDPQRIAGTKRSRESDDLLDESKRRRRSNSNSSAQFDLSDEDRLLLKLKEEEAMPWKEIAARFQTDLGKSYQIPALQMRLKRLRERMRVWTESDVRALRMAHEYWVQSKFDIISQKMLEFGAAEKWTARQCARKWAEMDPTPVLYTHIEHQAPTSYTPYMSPVEPPSASFMPYLHV